MASVPRRSFLKFAAAGALSASSWGCGQSIDEPTPPARFTLPEHPWMLPPDKQPTGCLETFLLGGFNPFDTFYVVPGHGDPRLGGAYVGQQWWTFQADTNCLWKPIEGGKRVEGSYCETPRPPGLSDAIYEGRTVAEAFSRCGGADRPLLVPFGTDAVGRSVHLGPFIYPLRDRPDLLKRMRVWVMSHDLDGHAGAVPIAMTGHGQGTPRMASFGARLSAHYRGTLGYDHPDPLSYAIYQSRNSAAENSDVATAVGPYPASNRPMSIRLGHQGLLNQLKREATSGRTQHVDALVDHYAARMQRRMSHRNGPPVRSRVLADFLTGRSTMGRHEALLALMNPQLFEMSPAQSCGSGGAGLWLPEPGHALGELVPDETSTSLDIAIRLLNSNARYVNVIDEGIYCDNAGSGYDTHGDHVMQSATNVTHFFGRLAERINEPGEGDPNKIDLDQQLVLINTEFGRSPYPEFTREIPGTNHWPWGYVVVGLGGPIDEEHSGVVGAIGSNGRPASGGFTPAEHRAAMLLAMGVWPFDDDGFGVGDIRYASSRLDAAYRLREEVWGYKSS